MNYVKNLLKNVDKNLLKNVDVIKLQNIMENVIHGSHDESRDGNGLYNKSRDLMYAKDCLDSEFQEVLQLLPWKQWKLEKYKKMTLEDVIEMMSERGGEISMEVSDMIFFMSVMFINAFNILELPITDDTKKILYLIKYRENIERIRQGVFDKTREFTEEEEKMLSNIDKILGE